MLNRRFVLGAPAGVAALFAAASSRVAFAANAASQTLGVKVDPKHLSATQLAAHTIKLPKQEVRDVQDFLTGFREWVATDLGPVANFHSDDFLESKGLTQESPMSIEQAFKTMIQDPIYATRTRCALSCQQLTWASLMNYFHNNRDTYLGEMEKTDKAGPGSLELNPGMSIPDYTRHEIHIQPGGYVGDEFAGPVYHYGTKNFYQEENDHDEIHIALAQQLPTPADGKVLRILDLGCGVGQYTTALKDRFPDAEVWGIDVGGPMVRYAHYRAVHLASDVNFAQRLAEETRFPDGHFDIVTSYIMFHEVNFDGANKIAAEAYRVLRPGGLFIPFDFTTAGHPKGYDVAKSPLYRRAGAYMNHYYNGEIWDPDYRNSDFPGTLRKAGFKVEIDGEAVRSGMPFTFPNVLAVKA